LLWPDRSETHKTHGRSRIGHPYAAGEPVFDVTFENVPAELRTDILFRAPNQREGLVLGTGDMSEGALGWATYGVGDHSFAIVARGHERE
jgi:NH3-dependent NAD+ synthetase